MVAGTVVSAATAVVGGVAAYQQSQSAADAATQLAGLQTSAADQNAVLAKQTAERNAQVAIRRAEAQAEIVGRDRQRRMGLARAYFGARGVQLTGTPLDAIADRAAGIQQELDFIRAGGAEDATTARFAGEMAARNESLRAAGISYSAELESRALRSAGFGALIGGIGSAVGTTLLGVGEASYYQGLGPPAPEYYHPETFVGRAR